LKIEISIDRSSNISSSTFASDLRHPPTRRRRRFCNLNNDPDFDTCEAPQEIDNDEIDVLLNAQEAAEEKRAAEAADGRDVVCEPVAAGAKVRLPPIRPRSRGARDSLRTDFSRRHSSPALPSQRTFDR
jgi:ribosomal protein L22